MPFIDALRVAAMLLAFVAFSAHVTEVPEGATLTELAKKSTFKGKSDGEDSFEFTGTYDETRVWSGILPTVERHDRTAADNGKVSPEPICGPRTFVWGEYALEHYGCKDPGGEWAPAELITVEDETAEQQEGAAPQVITVSREDVQSLLVNSGSLVVQPDQSWVLVNIDTIVMTDAAEHVLGTEVLGLDVDVRVAPASFTWDFGDGSAPLTGTDPGTPWPNHTVSHIYREAGTVSISLRTEWDAAFRVEGATGWSPVVGRAVTTATSDPIEVITATPRLTTGGQ